MPRKTSAVLVFLCIFSRASMRPRPDAAENLPRLAGAVPVAGEASMRPRPDAAENPAVPRRCRPRHASASMRPRPDAAENELAPAAAPAGAKRFNEAAARCRGKRRTAGGPGAAAGRFNEAAARCRGKRPLFRIGGDRAAASMRPRPDAAENPAVPPERTDEMRQASMRPRPDAAENPPSRAGAVPGMPLLQ